ncbi:MAG: thioesterase II family protein [Leptolyngbyaceae cyanobacterium]
MKSSTGQTPSRVLEQGKKWLVPLGQHDSHAQLSLFCFAPAGAGSNFFRQWSALLPDGVNLWAIRLPGRETQLRQPLITNWPDLMEPLVTAMVEHCHQPFAIFGHSLGALIGFEVVCQLRDRLNILPQALVVSARRAPHIPVNNRSYQRDDATLIAELRADGGTPEAVLQNTELMAMILPIYRADLQLNQEYQYQQRDPLSCPMLILGGQDDNTISQESLRQWHHYTQAECAYQLFPGQHMYITQAMTQQLVVQCVLDFVMA